MALMNRKRAAVLLAVPALMVPAIEIPLVMWARSRFVELNPDYINDPPTISRSINDPTVGAPFADFILLITALILMVTPVLIWSYALAISRLTLSRRRRILMYALLGLVFIFQAAASKGMVLTTQFTFAIDHDMHMLGSYAFFVFQALTIFIAGLLCRMLFNEQQRHGIADVDWQFRPSMHRLRFRFAMLIMGLVVLYGVLFVLKDHSLPISDYIVQVAYTQCEVIVIACYVLFLGSYAVDIHHMVRHDTLRLGGPQTVQKAVTGKPVQVIAEP